MTQGPERAAERLSFHQQSPIRYTTSMPTLCIPCVLPHPRSTGKAHPHPHCKFEHPHPVRPLWVIIIQYTFWKTPLFSHTGRFVNIECPHWTRSSSLHIVLWIYLHSVISTGHKTKNNATWRSINYIKCRHVSACSWSYSMVFSTKMLVNTSLRQSALSWRWLTYVVCVHTFQQDDPCLQKTKTFQASNVLCEFGSAVCATAGAFCETCTVYMYTGTSGRTWEFETPSEVIMDDY